MSRVENSELDPPGPPAVGCVGIITLVVVEAGFELGPTPV